MNYVIVLPIVPSTYYYRVFNFWMKECAVKMIVECAIRMIVTFNLNNIDLIGLSGWFVEQYNLTGGND